MPRKVVLEAEVIEKLEDFKSKKIISDILNQLKSGLSKTLYYHNFAHAEDVLHEALLFAIHDKLSDREIELLAIAVAYHDSGFLQTADEHEAIGAKFATEAMRADGGYSREEIDLVHQMILDTKVMRDANGIRLPPTSDLSRYLLDADLSNLGRVDFFERLELMRLELGSREPSFLRSTLHLIGSHEWYTDAARKLREKQRRKNLRNLRAWILTRPSQFDEQQS